VQVHQPRRLWPQRVVERVRGGCDGPQKRDVELPSASNYVPVK
jgi:hypothetical protein